MSDRVTIGGTVYESFGSNTSNLLLKCNGTARIQWGSKLIDLIKNGKLAISENSNNIFVVAKDSEIKSDGLYVVNENENFKILIYKNGNRYDLSGTNLYISTTSEQQLTADQKQQALINLGVCYNTLEELKTSDKNQGFAYVIENNTLYTLNQGEYNKVSTEAVEDALISNSSSEVINSSDNVANTSEFASSNTFTRGMIVMYSGKDIPKGWAICDGQSYTYNGITSETPNLSDKFIKMERLNNLDEVNNALSYYSLIFIMKL